MPLADEVTRADAEERALRLSSHRLGEVRLARARGAIQQDTLPWRALSCEEMGELDGQDDSLFECRLCAFEACDVVPLDIGLLGQDGTGEACSQLLDLWILVVVLAILSERSSIPHTHAS